MKHFNRLHKKWDKGEQPRQRILHSLFTVPAVGVVADKVLSFLSGIAATRGREGVCVSIMTVHHSLLNIFIDCMMYGFKLPSVADVSLERVEEWRRGRYLTTL